MAALWVVASVLAAPHAFATEIIVGGSHRASSGGHVQMIVGRPAATAGSPGQSDARHRAATSARSTFTDAAPRSASAAAARSGRDAAHAGDAARDSDRQWILERELEKERSAIVEKQRLLSQPSAAASDPVVVALRARLGSEVVDHERNVLALQRELERAKSTGQ